MGFVNNSQYVLKNHKNRSHENRMKYSRSPSFIRIRATKLQVFLGDHHITAIDEVKKMLTKEGLDPDDFDLVSFDWSEGLFLDTLFSKPKALSIWYKCKEFEEVKFLCILEFKWKLNSSPNPASQPKSL